MAKLSVPIHELAQSKLKALQGALSRKGQPATYQQIVSALVYGTTVPQASGMLIEFNQNSARAKDDAEEGRSEPVAGAEASLSRSADPR